LRKESFFFPSIHPSSRVLPHTRTKNTCVTSFPMTLFFGYATCCANAQREELLELASVFFPTLCSHYNFPFSSGISMSLFFFKGRRDTRRGSEGVIIQFYASTPPFSIQTLQLYTRNSRWHALWWVKPSKKDKIILGWNFELRWNLNVIIRCSFALLYSIPRNGIIFVLLIWIIIQ
jgi:hypothetical protein